ncbi:hypothetical protein ACEPAG_2818 [Sanghuangporus baumii]
MLQLNCLSLDEPSYGYFSVCVDPSTKLSKLKRPIYERLDTFYNSCRLDIPDLKLYLPSGLLIQPTDSLVERAKIALQSSRRLPEFDKLSIFFPHEPDRRHIHILIYTAEIIKKRKRAVIDDPVEIRHAKTLGLARYTLYAPEAALPDRLPSEQSKYPIYNGRSDSCRGPPLTIYNKVFAELKDALEDVSNIEVTAQELKAAHMLLTMSVKFYCNEGHRMEQTDLELEKLLGYSITNTAPGDGLVKTYLHEQRVILACLRWRNELGSEGDAGYHAACSYRQYVTDSEVSLIKLTSSSSVLIDDRVQYEEVRKRTCSPAIIVGIMGPYLCLMGGIFVDEIIVQPFTDYLFLGGDPDYGKRVLHIARTFKATKRALRELEHFYETSLGDNSNCAPHLPRPSVIDESDPCPNLRFVDRLFTENVASTLYSAKMDGRDVVVKFTNAYCGDAHRLLASHGLAPQLHFCGRIRGGLWMVVMDYVQGYNSNDYLTKNGLPADIVADVRKAVGLLHDEGYVFGDLRPENILVVEEREANTNGALWMLNGSYDNTSNDICPAMMVNDYNVYPRLRAVLIDFDWCGKDSEARYPTTLNDTGDIDWAPGVERFGLMKKEHDDYRLRNLGSSELQQANGHR